MSDDPAAPLHPLLSDPLCAAVVALVEEACALILSHYERRGRGEGVADDRAKLDDSPVTAADEEANALLVAGLRALTPEAPIIAEESVAAGEAPSLRELQGARRLWLVDPLDGTKEFISRNGEFTVNVALIEEGAPALGVVGCPALGLIYVGRRGVGAARGRRVSGARVSGAGVGAWEPISARLPPAPPALAVCVESRSHPSRRLAALLEGAAPLATRALGSSLKLCALADGGADVYPREGEGIKAWDVAAAHAVLWAAGGDLWRLEPATEPVGGAGARPALGAPCRYLFADDLAALLAAGEEPAAALLGALRCPSFVATGLGGAPWAESVLSLSSKSC